MSKELAYKPFGQLLSRVIDNRGRTCPTSESGMPLIATNCVKNETLYPVYEKVRFISDDVYENWFRGHPEPGDMIFVTKGTPGRVCWVPEPVGFCIAQDMVAIRANEKEVYPKYLFAALRSKTIQDEIENLHVGSLIPHFKKGDFNDLKIPIPNAEQQKFIGDFYFTLSLKIDLLHRQNKTLEALAETLFRQWFVEEAEESWETFTLDSFFPVVTGKKDANYATDNGEYPFFTCSQRISFCDGFSFDGHAILLAGNGDFNLKRYKGKFEAYQRTYVLIPFEEKFIGFLFALMKYFLRDITSSAQGSVISFLTKGMITDYKIRLPKNKELLNERLRVFNEFDEKVDFNLEQIRKLTKLRDTLLPKLMSGEVRVKIDEAETAIAGQ